MNYLNDQEICFSLQDQSITRNELQGLTHSCC